MAGQNHKKETVLVVHGTFAGRPEYEVNPKPTMWYEPQGSFCKRLDQALENEASTARCWLHLAPNDKHFYWDGANSWLSRYRTARRLKSELRRLDKEGWLVHLVGHSHGGNVIFDALMNGGRRPEWFKGRIALLGTPFYADTKLETIKRGMQRTLFWTLLSLPFWWWFLVKPGLAAGVGEAFNGQPWMQYCSFFAIAAVGTAAMIRVAGTVRTVTGQPERKDDAYLQSPAFLFINSRFDEAFRSLSKAKAARNPLKQPLPDTDATKETFFTKVRARIKQEAGAIAGIIKTNAEASTNSMRRIYKTESLFITWLLGIILLAFTVVWQRWFPAWLSDIPQNVAVSFGFILILSILAIGAVSSTRFFKSVIALPGVLVLKTLQMTIGMVLGLLFHVSNGWIKNAVWSYLKQLGLGVGGGPRGVNEIEVTQSFPLGYPEDSLYLELPASVADQTLVQQKEKMGLVYDLIMDSQTTWTPTGMMERLEIEEFPLIHSSYYENEECIRLIARWIVQPMTRHLNMTRSHEATEVRPDGTGFKSMVELPNEYLWHVEKLQEMLATDFPDWKKHPPTESHAEKRSSKFDYTAPWLRGRINKYSGPPPRLRKKTPKDSE